MKFYSELAKGIIPYTAGEQPRDKRYIKLNTNENPYPPSEAVRAVLTNCEVADLRLYPDPSTQKLKEALAQTKQVEKSNIFAGNGSDEVLSMCFAAFFDKGDTIAFADITYSFYEVYASYYGLNVQSIPLRNYELVAEDYKNLNCKGILIANPNAPTGSAITKKEVEEIVQANKDKIVIIDQAYIAFCEESAIELIQSYDNLVVVETLSKSHSLAGIRCGYAIADKNLIGALERIKDSINSYTINRLSMDIATVALLDTAHYKETTQKIVATRERVFEELVKMNLPVKKSSSNFLFVPLSDAKRVYLELKERGILVRYFSKKGIDNFIRITIGNDEDMNILLKVLKEVLEKNT